MRRHPAPRPGGPIVTTTQWRPNILFLLVDCLRADCVDGRRRFVRVPNLLRLARGGLHATQMIAAATTTTPCVASILTGTYSPRHGIRSLRGYRLRPHLVTLPAELQRLGYHTHADVTGPLLPAVGLDRGFTSYVFRDKGDCLDTGWGSEVIRHLTTGLPEPWFAFIHLWELHLPRHVSRDLDSWRFGRNRYERALSSLDANLAPVLAALDGRTLIVVHGDHGEQLGAPRHLIRFYRWQRKKLGRHFPPWASFPVREGHGFDVWEGLIRVPFVLHCPGRVAARRLPQLTRQVDIMPTLLELLGVEPPADIDGRSLLPTLGSGNEPEREAYVEACGATIVDPRDYRRAIRSARWKYIETADGTGSAQLYDVVRDPRERHNVIDREPAVAAEFREKLAERLATDEGSEDSGLSSEEQAVVDAQLRNLGYIE